MDNWKFIVLITIILVSFIYIIIDKICNTILVYHQNTVNGQLILGIGSVKDVQELEERIYNIEYKEED